MNNGRTEGQIHNQWWNGPRMHSVLQPVGSRTGEQVGNIAKPDNCMDADEIVICIMSIRAHVYSRFEKMEREGAC